MVTLAEAWYQYRILHRSGKGHLEKEVMDEEWDRVIPVWNIFIRLGIFGPNIVPRQNLDPYVTSTLAY